MMQAYKPSPNIAIRDNMDEELSDDVDDDVFIRDRKSREVSEENGLKRPLMAPRRREKRSLSSKKNNVVASVLRKKSKCWKCCEPFVYALSALVVLISAVFLVAYVLTIFPITLQKVKVWFRNRETAMINKTSTINDTFYEYSLFKGELTPCTQITVNKIWSKSFSNLNSESPVRKCDISNDGIEDVIIGFGVDDGFEYAAHSSVPKCEIDNGEYREMVECRGGVLALDGASGKTLWQRWTSYNIFSLYCKEDLNLDQQADCVASGRGQLIIAINARNGEVLWESNAAPSLPDTFAKNGMANLFDLFTINGIRDLDDDKVADIVAVHLKEIGDESQNGKHPQNSIQLISGQTGKTLRSISTPYQEDIYIPLQLMSQYDGTETILIATGGQNSPGGLYLINIFAVMQNKNENAFTTIFRNPSSGFMVPPILTDINNDGIEDIIISLFNSTVFAFNGKTLDIIWKYVFPASESISSIVPGNYNHDSVPDFMIKYNSGPGFPIYYYSQTQVLNGIDGTPLLEQMINDSGGPNSLLGGLSISQTFGGDIFLHWQTECREMHDFKDVYQFIPNSNILLQSRADTCMLRYNRSTVLKQYATSRHIQPPGTIIFTTDDLLLQLNQTDELKQSQNQYPVSSLKHPKLFKKMFHENYISNGKLNEVNNLNIQENNRNEFKEAIENKRIQNSRNKKIFDKGTAAEEYQNKHDYYSNNVKNIVHESEKSNKVRYEDDKLNNINHPPNQVNTDEYDNYYDDISVKRNQFSDRYLNNRGIRSEEQYSDQAEISNQEEHSKLDTNNPDIQRFNNTRQETLWGLELEKEHNEAEKDFSSESYKMKNEIQRQTNTKESTQNILPAISSAGILLKPLTESESSLDYVFVLNVRESELYPPLILPEDVACMEDKLNIYKSSYSADDLSKKDLVLLEKEFIESCLSKRLPKLSMHRSKYESQIVVTRLSIKCGCGTLKTGEQCSKFKPFAEQPWTEYMGNLNNGLYPSS